MALLKALVKRVFIHSFDGRRVPSSNINTHVIRVKICGTRYTHALINNNVETNAHCILFTRKL